MADNPGTLVVHFDKIMVNSISTSAGIFVGTNSQYGWSSHNKENANICGISGDSNEFVNNVNILHDDDLIDTPIDDRDLMIQQTCERG
jgi:hypothetical protein